MVTRRLERFVVVCDPVVAGLPWHSDVTLIWDRFYVVDMTPSPHTFTVYCCDTVSLQAFYHVLERLKHCVEFASATLILHQNSLAYAKV